MSKPIKLTKELKDQALKEFKDSLNKLKMSDGKVSYNKSFTYKEDEKAIIILTPLAYTKMLALLTSFDTEVAWHGIGKRIDTTKFAITDIVVYPQTVTGSNVDMDPERYAHWLMKNDDDERFNNIVMQGHSHVNFGTTPSPVDTKHQEDILSQLSDDMFYIFMIWNKRLEHTTKIYDLKENTLYEDSDIVYTIADEEYKIEAFMKDAKEQVVKKVTQPTNHPSGFGGYTSYPGVNSKPKENKKPEIGNGWRGRFSDEDDYYNRT